MSGIFQATLGDAPSSASLPNLINVCTLPGWFTIACFIVLFLAMYFFMVEITPEERDAFIRSRDFVSLSQDEHFPHLGDVDQRGPSGIEAGKTGTERVGTLNALETWLIRHLPWLREFSSWSEVSALGSTICCAFLTNVGIGATEFHVSNITEWGWSLTQINVYTGMVFAVFIPFMFLISFAKTKWNFQDRFALVLSLCSASAACALLFRYPTRTLLSEMICYTVGAVLFLAGSNVAVTFSKALSLYVIS